MKKIVLIVLVFITVLGLSACNDKKFHNETITVIFFTANFGATEVESYFDVEPNSLIDEPEDPSRQGFTFNGWYKDLNSTESWDFDTDKVGETSIVLYAGWDPTEFDIIYDLNGGTMTSDNYPTTFYAGDNKVLPMTSKPGFQFVAWYRYDWVDASSTKSGDPGIQVLPTEQYEDLYLYAHYKAVEVRVTFTTNYPEDTGGPEKPSTKLVKYGTTIDFVMFDDTNQYTFLGWNSRADGTGTFYVNGDPFERTQRTILYGVWELIE